MTGGESREFLFDRIADQVGCGLEAQLIEQAPLVGADGLGAQMEVGGDLAGGPAGGKGEQDLPFLGRKTGVEGGGRRVVTIEEIRFSEMPSAIEDVPDGLQQIGTAGVLRDIARGAELKGAGGVECIGLDAQHEHGGLAAEGADLAEHGEAIAIGEADIENDETPGPGPDSSEGFLDGSGLGDGDVPELVAKYLLKTLPDEEVVVDDEDREFVAGLSH